MKKVMKRIWILALLAVMSNRAMADDVTVVISSLDGGTIVVKGESGVQDETTGNTVYMVGSQTVIIAVTPVENYKIDKSKIEVIPIRDPASATRTDGDDIGISDPLTLTLVDEDGTAIVDGEGDPVSDPDDLTAARYYAFTIPVGLGAWVDATFEQVESEGKSGTIEGTDVTWAVTGDEETMTLTLGGEGAATISDTTPWDAFVTLIKSLIVGDGVQELGDGLLASCPNLTSITLQGEKVVSLGRNDVTGLTVDVVGNLYNEYKNDAEGWGKATITSTTGVVMEGVAFGENNNYDTFVSTEALKIPSVLSAYIITGVDGNKVLLTKIEDGIIPAGVPVLLFTEDFDDDDFRTASSSDGGSASQGILFAAPSGGKPVNLGDVYLLYNDKFYLCQAGTIPEGGIYLDITEKSSSDNNNRTRSVIVIGDDTTGIDFQSSMFNVQSEEWYDLQGRKVINPTKKGIYIKDGRKVVIK